MSLGHNSRDNVRTDDVQITQDITFDTMFLSLNTLNGLKGCGFLKPSPIQLHGIPLGKCGFDLLLEAKSGTGKTAVFTVVALEKFDLKKGLQVMMLAPTREIASQICDVLRQIGGHYEGLRIEAVMGGLPVQEDIDKFKNNVIHMVVGSPGRIKHLIQDKHMDISAVRLLVLDEADKLMEKSFLPDIKYIHTALPKQKQVILSSATFPDETKNIISQFVRDPQHLCPNSGCVLLGVAQKFTTVKYNSNIIIQTETKFKELLSILTKKQFKQCLIFCNYQARVGEVHKLLTKAKWPAEQLYGDQDQTDRLDALKTLQEYKCRILIATDLAARGIDASNVDLVVNFEPPHEWQTYLHRIGRSGRFGSYGLAVTILSEGAEYKKFMTVIDNLKVTNFQNLWSDDVVGEATVDKDPPESTATLDPKCYVSDTKEYWDYICGKYDKNKDDERPETFDELLNSLRNTKIESPSITEYETFADLLASFNNSKLTAADCDFEYRHIPMEKKTSLNFNSNFPLNRNVLKGNIGTHSKKSANYCDHNSNSCGDRDCDNRKLSYKTVSPFKSKHINRCNRGTSMSNEMESINLQLATALSISKTEEVRCEKSKRKTFTQFEEEMTVDENPDDLKKKTPKNLLKKSEHASKESRYSHEQPHSSSKYSSKNTEKPRDNSGATKKDKKNQSYEQWYSELKLKVKYLELALYVEELKKL